MDDLPIKSLLISMRTKYPHDFALDSLVLWIYLSNYQEDYIMERVVQFLKEAETYYLATVEGDQPRVGLV